MAARWAPMGPDRLAAWRPVPPIGRPIATHCRPVMVEAPVSEQSQQSQQSEQPEPSLQPEQPDDAAGFPVSPSSARGRDLAQVGIEALQYDEAGLIPVVVQQHDSGEVLMVAWADAHAVQRTLELGEAVFFSRSRQEQWHKGATSGNTQRVLDVRVDCDADVLLYLVDQGADGVACHTGERSCFHRRLGRRPNVEEYDS